MRGDDGRGIYIVLSNPFYISFTCCAKNRFGTSMTGAFLLLPSTHLKRKMRPCTGLFLKRDGSIALVQWFREKGEREG